MNDPNMQSENLDVRCHQPRALWFSGSLFHLVSDTICCVYHWF